MNTYTLLSLPIARTRKSLPKTKLQCPKNTIKLSKAPNFPKCRYYETKRRKQNKLCTFNSQISTTIQEREREKHRHTDTHTTKKIKCGEHTSTCAHTRAPHNTVLANQPKKTPTKHTHEDIFDPETRERERERERENTHTHTHTRKET